MLPSNTRSTSCRPTIRRRGQAAFSTGRRPARWCATKSSSCPSSRWGLRARARATAAAAGKLCQAGRRCLPSGSCFRATTGRCPVLLPPSTEFCSPRCFRARRGHSPFSCALTHSPTSSSRICWPSRLDQISGLTRPRTSRWTRRKTRWRLGTRLSFAWMAIPPSPSPSGQGRVPKFGLTRSTTLRGPRVPISLEGKGHRPQLPKLTLSSRMPTRPPIACASALPRPGQGLRWGGSLGAKA
mmetsp:Transcript_26685/g.59693  ORF Transcript_26685/g.59693 Transcript_26685/m.59693 type:complete len:241 (+) Transcript_26685:1752-2474(+)